MWKPEKQICWFFWKKNAWVQICLMSFDLFFCGFEKKLTHNPPHFLLHKKDSDKCQKSTSLPASVCSGFCWRTLVQRFLNVDKSSEILTNVCSSFSSMLILSTFWTSSNNCVNLKKMVFRIKRSKEKILVNTFNFICFVF